MASEAAKSDETNWSCFTSLTTEKYKYIILNQIQIKLGREHDIITGDANSLFWGKLLKEFSKW